MSWFAENQGYLMAAIAVVRARFEGGSAVEAAERERAAAERAMSKMSAIEALSIALELSPFEREVLLACAGAELSSSFAELCASVQGDPQKRSPTFGLALAALSEPHWSAVTPEGSLRKWRLVEMTAGASITAAQLRIDERILSHLTGIDYLDEALPVRSVKAASSLGRTHAAHVDRLVRAWSVTPDFAAWPIVQLVGQDPADRSAIAEAASSRLGLSLASASVRVLPGAAGELQSFLRLWRREALLCRRALLIECEAMEAHDGGREPVVAEIAARLETPLFVSAPDRKNVGDRPMIIADVEPLSIGEVSGRVEHALGANGASLNGAIESVVTHFRLGRAAIESLAAESAASTLDRRTLWETCRRQSRGGLDELAQRIVSAATWDDLVLPDLQKQVLREIVMHVRNRFVVHEKWGFAAKGRRGLGISAMFSGPSGTGKTLAAEVMASELGLDLYRIDLSQIVSKYIGETEKNLKKVFGAAEINGAILLFDEADALFGQRSTVKDSHDRYANIEVSYLLQRMEEYRGLAILTTNQKDALDNAFLRRIRFAVNFAFPDAQQRAEIWRRAFPKETPTEGIDHVKLSRLAVAGGNIRNVAIYAAFLAADANEPVRMPHLLRAARVECAKLERPLTDAEVGGWT